MGGPAEQSSDLYNYARASAKRVDEDVLQAAGVTFGPASAAARKGDACELERVLDADASAAEEESSPDGYRPLHWAACFGATDCVRPDKRRLESLRLGCRERLPRVFAAAGCCRCVDCFCNLELHRKH
eukprot:jgi/Chlat1/2291/Chrsp17S02794